MVARGRVRSDETILLIAAICSMRQPIWYLKKGRQTSELIAGIRERDLLQLLG
jgi:hypothetical protein